MPHKGTKKAEGTKTIFYMNCLLCGKNFASGRIKRGLSSYELPPCPRCGQSLSVRIYGTPGADLKLGQTKIAGYKRVNA